MPARLTNAFIRATWGRSLGVAGALLTSTACSNDPSSGGAIGGTSGNGGLAGSAGQFAIARPAGIYEVGPVNALFGNGGGGGQGGGGGGTASGGLGSGGGGPGSACVLAGPTGTPPATAVCGDGLLSAGEQCDDNNVVGGDSCSATCVALPHVVVPHAESSTPLPLSGRDLGHGPHPLAAGCNRVGVAFLDRAVSPAMLKLAPFTWFGIAQTAVSYGTTSVDEPSPSLAALPDDAFVSAWTDFDDDELGVRLRRLDPATRTQAAPLFANTEQAFSQRSPDVVFDGSQVVVAWVDNSDPLNGPDLRYRTFSPSLKPTSDELTLAATGAVEDHVVLAAQGNSWAAAWRSGSDGLETIEIKSGAAHWSVGPFLPGPADDNPALVFVDATHLVVAFTAGSDDFASGVANGSHLHGAVLDAAYQGHVESFAIQPKVAPYSNLLGFGQFEPTIARYADRLVVAWRSAAVPGAPEGDELWVREIRWTASGNSLLIDTSSPEQALLPSSEFRFGDQTWPVLLSSGNWPDHRMISAWQDNNGTFASISGLPDVGIQFSRVPSEMPSTPASSACASVTLGLTPSTLAIPPTTVTLRGMATCGGAAAAEYKFFFQGPELGAQHVIRDWGAASAAWSTTGLASGKYALTVYTRRAGTSVAFDSYAARDYFVGNVCNANPTISITPTGLQPQGTPLTLSAGATCNGTSAQYRFAYGAPGSSTLVDIGTWSTTPVTWNTTGLASGTYTIFAYIRGIGNSSTYEATAQGSADLGKRCYSVSAINTTPASPATVGTTVSLAATALCSSGASPEFRYYYRAPGSSTSVPIGNWSTGPVAWNTTGMAEGGYTLIAEVRAIGNTSSAESATTTNYSLQSAAPCSVILSAPSGPVMLGNTVTLNTRSMCSSGATYRFAYAPSGSGNYTEIAAWSASGSATWVTSSVGTFDVAVFVRKSGTVNGYDALDVKTLTVQGACWGMDQLGEWSGHPQAIGLTFSFGVQYSCDPGVTPLFGFFYRAPGETEYAAFPGVGWQANPNGLLDTSSFTVGGTYEIQIRLRNPGNLGGADLTSDGTLLLEDP